MSVYGKWDEPEDAEIAYFKVASGEWTFQRFEDWLSQVKLEEYRNNSNEDI